MKRYIESTLCLIVPQLQYTFNCLYLYIRTHIGSQGITYECSRKDESVIGVVLGLNRVKQWEYTSSPLYGPIFLLLQYTLKCLEPFIDTFIGYPCTKYMCAMMDVRWIGVVLGLNRVIVWKYTSSPLYGLFCSLLQYTFKCLELYIGTHIGSQRTLHQCSIKDKRVIGVVLVLNRV